MTDPTMTGDRAGYRTLAVSGIAAFPLGDGFGTGGLWARDINANAGAVAGLILLCPVGSAANAPPDITPLDPAIEVIARDAITDAALDAALGRVDVVELPGNGDWRRAAFSRRVLRRARRLGVPAIVGISSNRARTTVMNAAEASLPTRLRARLRAASIRLSQRHLMRHAAAVRIVGRGLLPLVEGHAREIRVDTASWITEADIRPPRPPRTGPVRVVIASRLEPMKGVAIGVEAVAKTIAAGHDIDLRIYGEGAEETALRDQVTALGLDARTRFMGQVGYPGPFFDALVTADYVLLTNLNDEQPRLIFDAISQGAVPVCPRNAAYLTLGLDEGVFYAQGDPAALGATLQALATMPEEERADLMTTLVTVARAHTIEAMHRNRSAWIAELLAARA